MLLVLTIKIFFNNNCTCDEQVVVRFKNRVIRDRTTTVHDPVFGALSGQASRTSSKPPVFHLIGNKLQLEFAKSIEA